MASSHRFQLAGSTDGVSGTTSAAPSRIVVHSQPGSTTVLERLGERNEDHDIGKNGLNVSRVAFGTWQLGGDWGHFDEDAAITAIRRARDLGVNFFDTAQAYGFGTSEHILGKALRDELTRDRDEVVIATKGGLRQTESGPGPRREPGVAAPRRGRQPDRAGRRSHRPLPGALARSRRCRPPRRRARCAT